MTSDLTVDATALSQSAKNEIMTAASATAGGDRAGSPAPADTEASGPVQTPRWRHAYARRLWLSDLLALIWVVYGTQIAWFGLGNAQLSLLEDTRFSDLSYWVFSALLIALWMWSLSFADSRSDRVIGVGATEYIRVASASFRLFGVIAIVAFLFRIDLARGFLLISLPAGILVLLLVRWMWRQWLRAQRRNGRFSARVLLVGSEASVSHLARELARYPESGYHVVGACVPTGLIGATLPNSDVPVMGSVDAVSGAIVVTGADTVAVTSTDELPPDKVKEISWGLEAGKQHLVLAPSIIDIAGPRIHMRPVSGLPLMHVETPRFSRGQRFVKRSFDVIVTSLLVLLLVPVLLGVGVAVKLTSKGPLLYKQERIGRRGEPFFMLKFRSMRVGADKELAALLEAQGTSTTPLFKIQNDPRITPIGRVIRKYSLDELPQLFNVIGGSMSLVGPRPQIAAEVALYDNAARRRLLARPGITGLWQVSGRSTLDWDQTVRLDLYYVENWSLLGDVSILARTAKAVAAPGESAR